MNTAANRASPRHSSRGVKQISGGLAFVERQRYGLRAVLDDTAAASAYAALQHDVAHGFFALAAARCDAELKLQLVERVDALGDGGADRTVRNGFADTDNHGRRHS